MKSYQHKIIQNHPRITVYKFDSEIPYIPHVDDTIWFPEDWKYGTQFIVTSVHHYPVEKLIVININKNKEEL